MVAKAIPTTAKNKAAVQHKDTRQTKGSKHQKSQKKTVKPEERIKRLFNSLCAQIDGGHFKNALKTCDKSKLGVYVYFEMYIADFILSIAHQA